MFVRNSAPVAILLLAASFVQTVSAAPFFSPKHPFPTARQSLNACYFYSVKIAVEAQYGAKIRVEKSLSAIGYDRSGLATWESKKKFSDLTHVTVREYGTKKDLVRLLDSGYPVLVSTEITLKSKETIRHVSVAYSYDTEGIYVSDPLDGTRKRIGFGEVFGNGGKVRFNNLRTVSVKPYAQWTDASKNREKKEDVWVDETRIK